MRDLYPDIEPFATGKLQVDGRHTLYFEQCGNPAGKPVVLLHGGPGGGCNARMRRFHDPAKYRIVLFDQRGSGRSTPHADLVDNTTWDLVDDIERLRVEVEVDKWQVFGGSWGSTLALAYAQKHPQRVTELVLRGIFMLRRWELEWFYQEGASRLFPDAWEHYLKAIPPLERHDLIAAFHRRLTSDDETTRLEAARAWSVWEGATSFLHVDPDFASWKSTTSCCGMRQRSPTSPVSSCMVVTTWSARCRTPGTCTRRGRRPSFRSHPRPDIPRSNPRTSTRWCAPPTGSPDTSLFVGAASAASLCPVAKKELAAEAAPTVPVRLMYAMTARRKPGNVCRGRPVASPLGRATGRSCRRQRS